jgi:hypothetical protein
MINLVCDNDPLKIQVDQDIKKKKKKNHLNDF